MESNDIAAEEALDAAEFCQDYGYLLKDPYYLIPSEDLKKLGLGHLCALNMLLIDKRNGSSENPIENQDSVSVRNLSVLNSASRFREGDRILNNGTSHHDSVSPPGFQSLTPFNQTTQPDVLCKDNSFVIQTTQASPAQNVSSGKLSSFIFLGLLLTHIYLLSIMLLGW